MKSVRFVIFFLIFPLLMSELGPLVFQYMINLRLPPLVIPFFANVVETMIDFGFNS